MKFAISHGRSKVSAVASVGASVLCTEVSTGHPHHSPTTLAVYFYMCRRHALMPFSNTSFVRSTYIIRREVYIIAKQHHFDEVAPYPSSLKLTTNH